MNNFGGQLKPIFKIKIMSDAKKNGSNDGGNKAGRKRNLPSWMSERDDMETSASASNSGAKDFSKLMEGVVFVLSGFVNPERGVLRSQALEMGAEYQPDWNSSSTLLVCAFPNTPKFRQVEADSGTIVSKEWVSECYKQRKLVEIEPYLMHAGKPWKRQTITREISQDKKSSSGKSQNQVEKSSNSKPTSSASSKDVPSSQGNDLFSPSKVKQWAVDDFYRTLSWLEKQDEKPEESEIRKVAAEGILTCLQDTIDTLKQEQSIQQITEQWACLPHAVEELAKFNVSSQDDLASVSKKDLCRHAMACKQIYESHYRKMEDDSSPKTKNLKRSRKGNRAASKNGTSYDSDETIEMTEDEIDKAFDGISSTLVDTSS